MERQKPVWIKASEVFRLTIWQDRNALMRAKKAKHIIMKRDDGIWYRLDNIHPDFKIQNTMNTGLAFDKLKGIMKAEELLRGAGFTVEGTDQEGLRIYGNPILMNDHLDKIREMFPLNRVYGNTNTQTIHLRIA